jgi:hypothetical protein
MKRKQGPDTRPHWSDPDLPVYGKSGKAYPPETMQKKAQVTMRSSTEPRWDKDPTYHMRKDRKS